MAQATYPQKGLSGGDFSLISPAIIERLSHIQDSILNIRRIEKRISKIDLDDELYLIYFHALLYNLITIGEAVRAKRNEITTIAPEIPWERIINLRNRLTHEYFTVDARFISETLGDPLSTLESRIPELLRK